MSILINWAVLTFSMYVASQLLSRMKIEGGFISHIVVSGLFGLLMALTSWFFATVVVLASFGLLLAFGFLLKVIVGAIVLKLTDLFSSRLKVEGFGTALLAALIMAVTSTATEAVLEALARG